MKKIKFWCLILVLLSVAAMLFACDAVGKTDETDNAGDSDEPVGYITQDGIIYFINNLDPTVDEFAWVAGVEDKSLVNVTIPSEVKGYPVTGISIGAFFGCSSLESITIPDSVTAIVDAAFAECKNLKNISMPDSVTYLGAAAFKDCIGLESVDLPNGIEIIEGSVFKGCTSLESIRIPASVTSIKYMELNIVLGAFVPNMGEEEIILDCIGGAFEGCTSLTSVVFEEGSRLESIGQSAFAYCTSLESITIPASVTGICVPETTGMQLEIEYERGTFSGCTSLKSVEFEKGSRLETIGDLAFTGCTSLESITIPASVTEIGASANIGVSVNMGELDWYSTIIYAGGTFSGCTSLKSVEFEENSQLKSIGVRVFEDCTSLANITIPNGVTKINMEAFSRCTDITSIIYEGTTEKWQGIKKETDWNKDTGNYVVTCTDGELEKE